MSATSVSSPINSTNQFFPLILAAASTLPPSTSSAPTPLQLHLGNYSGSSSVAPASSQSIFLHPSVTTTASCLSVPNVLNSPSRLSTSGVTTASTPLVASLINKNCSTSPSVASVVISPQAPNHIQPTLALRFATHTSTQCSSMVTTATVNSSACPLVFETPTTNVTLPLQSQRSHCVTAINFPAPTSVSGSLLMSSTLCSTPRVLIHKSQNLSNPPSLIETPTTSTTTVSPSKMSTSDSSSTNLSNPAIIFHDQINTQSPQTSKTKLVNFTTPLSATVRLITPPSTVCATTKSTCTVSTSGNSAVVFPTSLSQTGALPTRPSIANTGSVWSGLTVSPNVSFMSPSSGNVVAIQSSQSLIVQTQSDLPVQSTIATSSSLNPSLMMSLRSFSGSSSNTGPSLPLSAANHAVLAFNLANSNVHSTPTTCTNVTGMFTNPVRQINSSNPTSPLIVRSSIGSLGTRGSTGDNSVVMVTSPSQMVSSGGHRITSSHCSQSADIHQTQTAAVYVLTTSVYPILSTTTVTSSNSSSGSESTCSASSIISPVVVSGPTNGVLQVRFRSPQPNVSPTVMTENQESKSLQVVSHNILPTSLHSISDVPKSVSEDSKYINPASKPLRCASESNPLLHHLVSSLKQSQNESTTDVSHMNNTDLKKSDPISTHSELSLSNSWLHNNIDDSKQANAGNFLNSNEKHNYFYPTTSRDNSELNNDFTDCGNKILNEKQLTTPIHNIPRKKIKGEQEQNECQNADDITIKNDFHSSNKPSKAGILWTVDPVDGREWILNGRPPRPLINPKCGLSNSRLSVPCRSKSSHFLSLSEICTKPQHKSANPDDSSRRGVQNTRRRRRSLVTGTNLSHAESDIQSKGGVKDMNSLNPNYESNEAKRLVQDILAVRAEQEDSGFVRFPLTITSVLDITGWRVLHCADNLDLLAYTELQTLETIKNMETDLADQLHCISTQSVTSSHLSVSQGVSETVKSVESGLKSDESEMASQFNIAIELIKGISQRKKYLLDSIQRISSVTKNLVHHFSPGIHNLIEELEDSSNNSSKSLSPSSSKTNLDSNTSSTPVTLRRSSRRFPTHNPIVRQVRRRNNVAITRGSKSLTSLIKNSPNSYPGTSSQGNICNGGTSNYSVVRIIFLQSVTGISQEIENLKLTLNQINTCLVEENNQLKCSDLLNLKKDLEELIELKEHELLNSRKAQLLAEIGSILADNQEKDDEVQGSSLQTDESTINEQSLVGQRCSVPGWTSSGKFIRQNALILSVVDHDGNSPDRVRVLLAHPTRLSEIPCERFFETGTCHRGIRCTRSHGKIFNIEDIGEWYEPDTEKYLQEGQPCLANDRNSDHNSLWHYARLLQTDFESGTCVIEWGHVKSQPGKNSVKRQSYGNLEDKVTSLPLECIHILENDDDIDSDISVDSDISSSTTDSGDSNDYLDSTTSYARPSTELINSGQTTKSQSCSQYDKRRLRVQFVFGNTLLPDQPPNLDTDKEYPNVNKEDKQSSIGDWEAHTRGIGSRLLASMGYPGYGGLGRCHQGRQSPVCTNLEKYQVHNVKWNHRPSLDNVVLSRKRIKNIACRDKAVEKSSKTPQSHVTSHSGSVFNLINMALLSTSSRNDQNPTHPNNNNNNTDNNTKNTVTSQISLTNCNESILKRKLFHTHEQINRLHNQISKAQDAIKRNEGRDRLTVKQAQQRVNDLQSQLIQLKENERTIVNIQNKQMKEKKLRIF
ncbi:hypothetical protein Smp_017080.1 [Schistosoma mansoni]|nr:hypothetical protein Smp_017080.1 [Schistosoma mansoni]|eukprot:XP_018655637.1 hypothetical protein Smp_017080.1 [Schistosoma mansoni]